MSNDTSFIDVTVDKGHIITIGERLLNPVSPRFARNRIGQFGIGKVASLAAASRFEITTQKDDFAARVIFDKAQWMEEEGSWKIPMSRLPYDPRGGGGALV